MNVPSIKFFGVCIDLELIIRIVVYRLFESLVTLFDHQGQLMSSSPFVQVRQPLYLLGPLQWNLLSNHFTVVDRLAEFITWAEY